ncbi:MAG: hypothetical protein ABJN36_13175 [Cyclobacteriaceae bacterium]
MLFLLKNIRRKLLTGNKVMTYLFYAIGEIFLVVVGIILAVQVDEYFSEKRDTTRVKGYLSDMIVELAKDTLETKLMIDRLGMVIKEKEWGLKRNEFDPNQTDSLIFMMTPSVSPLRIRNQSYSKIIDEGLITKLRDDSLSNSIREFYKNAGDYMADIIAWERDVSDQMEIVMFTIQNEFEFTVGEDDPRHIPHINAVRAKRVIDFAKRPQTRNNVALDLFVKKVLRKIYLEYVEDSKKLIKHIQKSLKD